MEYPNRRHGVQASDPGHLDTLRYGFFEEYLPAGRGDPLRHSCDAGAGAALSAQAPAEAAAPPSRADILRGEYGRYRAITICSSTT